MPALTAGRAPLARQIPVDAEIVLAADVSRSIDDGEFALQRKGYADAIQSQQLIDVISTGPHGAIAIAYVEWAGDGEEKVVVDWSVVRNAADARAFAAALTAAPRSYIGRTAIGAAIDYSLALFAESAYKSTRRVIDVSGDGTSNQGRIVTAARDAAVQSARRHQWSRHLQPQSGRARRVPCAPHQSAARRHTRNITATT